MNLAALRLAFAASLLSAASMAHALVFAVNEGVTYRVSNDEIRARYAAIATDLGALLGQPVRVEPVGDYAMLRKGLADRAYDLALVHPAHISIDAIKRSGYQLVAVTKGYQDYHASFLVRADAPFKPVADLRGLKLGAPDEDSITAWMVRATLRDAVGDAKNVAVTYTRYQDAVPFMVENTFTQAGATASKALVTQWQAWTSRPPDHTPTATPGMANSVAVAATKSDSVSGDIPFPLSLLVAPGTAMARRRWRLAPCSSGG